MTKEFDGKVALITGASSGMGKDFALRLIREGYTVYGGARRVQPDGRHQGGRRSCAGDGRHERRVAGGGGR